jgi:glucose/arabinose dehydrogenase
MQLRRPWPTVLGTVFGLLAGGAAAYWLTSGRPAPEGADLGPTLTGTFEGADVERPQVSVRLVPVAAGVGQPTDLLFVPGHPERMVVTSKWGSLHLVDVRQRTREHWIWLPVSDRLEAGVLGVAFDPTFRDSGRFWVFQTPRLGDAEGEAGGQSYEMVLTLLEVDPDTLEEPRVVGDILRVPEPAGTHNGGQIAFGPDGMLYVALGDGEAGNPERRSQDRSNLLGSLLRLDVSAGTSYAVPPDNPFVGMPGVRPEIWAYGLRNPWRFTFDARGRMVVADVGQSEWEEVNLVEAGDNLGWPALEGPDCYQPPEGCPREGMVDPVLVYGHDEGISITGGVEWTAPGPLRGHYLYADFGTGRFWATRLPPTRTRTEDRIALGRFDISPSAFTRTPDGRAMVADFRSERVYMLETALP